MIATLDGAAATPPTSEEVERARADLLRQIDLSTNDSEQLGMALSEFTARGDWRLMFIGRDRIRAATVDDVRRVAATYLKPVNRTVGVFTPIAAPVRAEIPRGAGHRGAREGLQGRRDRHGRRSLRSLAVEHRCPDVARRPPAGDQALAAAEEDPRRHRGRAVPVELRRRKQPQEPRRRRRAGPGDADPRHGEADAPADRRRDEPHQGERRRRRKRRRARPSRSRPCATACRMRSAWRPSSFASRRFRRRSSSSCARSGLPEPSRRGASRPPSRR